MNKVYKSPELWQVRNTGKILDYLSGDPPKHINMLKVLSLLPAY